MRGNERRNLTIRRSVLKSAKMLRITIAVLPPLWLAFFFFLRLIHVDLPRTVDIIILASVIAVCAILGLIDIAYSKKKCRCPYCGRQWSMLKYKEFRNSRLDLINNTKEYICYNCKEEVEII